MFNIRSILLEWNFNLALRWNVTNISHFENSQRICRKKNGMQAHLFTERPFVYRTGNTPGIVRRLQTAARRDGLHADLHAL